MKNKHELSREDLINQIKKELKSKHSSIHKLIEIKGLIQDNFVIDDNEDIPELKDPKKEPITFSLKHK